MDSMKESKLNEPVNFPAPAPEETPNTIVVNDGMERVSIKNAYGYEDGVFYFRPTDIGIIERYNDFVSELKEITAPLNSANIENDGTAKKGDQASFDALKEAEKRLNEAVNVLFGGNFAEAFFGKMHPFSPVKGRFYCEEAIEKVGAYINARFDTEIKQSENRVAKYTSGYQTGKHRNGRKRNRGGRKA